MSRMYRPSLGVLGGLVMCGVLGLAAACSDSNNATSAGDAAPVETAPPPAEDPGLAPAEESVPPAEEPAADPGASGEGEEVPPPEEQAPANPS